MIRERANPTGIPTITEKSSFTGISESVVLEKHESGRVEVTFGSKKIDIREDNSRRVKNGIAIPIYI